MEFLTATTTYTIAHQGASYYATSAGTLLLFTEKGMNLINFFVQFFTVSFGLIFGLLAVVILLLIFKP